MENDRLVYIDFYRGIGMILVVMGHVYFGSLFNTFIHAFHMPLFFFISGYLYHKEERISYAIQKKAKRFLIPYFTYGFFVVIIYWILYRVDIRNMLFHLFLNNSKDLEAAGGMWFLTASFIVSCFFILIDKFCSRFYLKQCFILLLCVLGLCLNTKYGNNLPWSFVSALVSLVFFDAGYLVKLTEDRIKKRSSALIFIAFILSLFAIFYNGEVNLRIGKFNNIVLFFFNGVVMSIVLLDVCKVFVGSPPPQRIRFVVFCITEVGRNSLVYLGLNQLFIELLSLNKFCVLSKVVNKILTLIIVLLMLFATEKVLKKQKWSRWIL